MTSNAEPGPVSGKGSVGVSGPTRSLWLGLLGLSSAVAGGALVLTGVVAALLNGWTGVVSSSLGGLLVVVFFAISLLIGHFVGRNNPSGAVGLFVATYFVKVIGFAVVLFVVAVVTWQAAEIYGFSKARLQIFNDPEPAGDSKLNGSSTDV
jgi:ATP synthase protein I